MPTGTVTFLFTDVEGSTRKWQEHPVAMQSALAHHDELVRTAIDQHRGYVVKTTGDGFHAAFATATDAVHAAVAAQRAIEAEPWVAVGTLRVRMGLHTGEAGQRDGDYYGPALNRAARLMSAAHGGQIVCSQTSADLVRDELGADLRLRDLGIHQLRDLERPERVFEIVGDDLGGDFPPLRSLDIYPGNLPSRLSSFVGRTADLEQLANDIERSQIVTLTGVGGVGKTRLAVQLCADSLPRFPDGAWFVDLAPVRDGDQVATTIAKVLGVNERPGEAIEITLRDALREREALVLLDNGEHLIDAVSDVLIELTRRDVAARFVVTTREPLGIDGEQVRRVTSLDTATASALFVQRAGTVRADVDWDAHGADIASICEQLDGIPLAVELAAARTRSMLPADILRRLDERFRLLQGSRRSARERHQTLLAAVEWSYDLLTPEEQACFDRLAVFRGGFDLEAAEAVCAGGLVDAIDVVDLLERLVDKSMVLAIQLGRRSSYRLLETMRQFASSKLAASGTSDECHARHVAYFMRLACEWGPLTRTSEQQAVIERLLPDRANLNAMLDRLFEEERWSDAAEVCRHLSGFWSTTVPEDGRRWILGVEAHASELELGERLEFLANGSYVLANCTSTIEACRLARRAIDEAVAAGREPEPHSYFALTWHAQANGDPEAALELARTGRELARRPDQAWIELLIRMQGWSALAQVDPPAALGEVDELWSIAEQSGAPTFIAVALFSRGYALARIGQDAAAEECFAQAIDVARDTVLHIEISVLLWRGILQVERHPDEALRLLREGITRAEHHGILLDPVLNAYEAIAGIWLEQGRLRDVAVLTSAVDRVREVVQVSGTLPEASRRDRIHRVLDEQLDDDDRQALTARGLAFTRDDLRRFVNDELPLPV